MGLKEVPARAAGAGHEGGRWTHWLPLAQAKGAIRKIARVGGRHEALRTWVRQAWERTRALGPAPPPTRPNGSKSLRKRCENREEPMRSLRARQLVYHGGV